MVPPTGNRCPTHYVGRSAVHSPSLDIKMLSRLLQYSLVFRYLPRLRAMPHMPTMGDKGKNLSQHLL